MMKLNKDEIEINKITARFFDLFTNTNGQVPKVQQLKEFFLPNGIIINNTSGEPAIYDVDDFIEPREKILTDGTLIDFKEWETSATTVVHGNIAHRILHYEKSGVFNGEPYKGRGKKMLQFIKIKNKWILSSVVWSDV